MNYLIKNIWVLLLLLTSSLSAQELEVSYEVLPQAADKHLVRVYVQSTSEQPLDLRAVNFSFAFEGKCAALETFESIFDQSWTRHLVENQQYGELDLHYDQAWYSTRLQYGNADPGLPATAQLTAPAKGEAPLQVMELTFTGSWCPARLFGTCIPKPAQPDRRSRDLSHQLCDCTSQVTYRYSSRTKPC